ncbi:MAG: hypothetical protein ACREVN_08205 [Gammaproteobacteria bacterium]
MKTRTLPFLGLVLSLSLAHAGPDPVAPIMEIPGSGSIPAAGDTSRLSMAGGSIKVRVQTSGLDPSTPHTVWAVIFNHPEFCHSTPCSSLDFPTMAGHDPRVEATSMFVTGGRSDADGNGHFVGRIYRLGPDGILTRLVTWGPGLLTPNAAEIHIVVRNHGAPAPQDVDAAITSFTGGCNADNAVQPPCGNVQVAIHLAR